MCNTPMQKKKNKNKTLWSSLEATWLWISQVLQIHIFLYKMTLKMGLWNVAVDVEWADPCKHNLLPGN